MLCSFAFFWQRVLQPKSDNDENINNGATRLGVELGAKQQNEDGGNNPDESKSDRFALFIQ